MTKSGEHVVVPQWLFMTLNLAAIGLVAASVYLWMTLSAVDECYRSGGAARTLGGVIVCNPPVSR